MTLQERIIALVQAIGADIRALYDELNGFITTLGENASAGRDALGIQNHQKLLVGADGELRVVAPFGYAENAGVGAGTAQTVSKSEPVGMNTPCGSILLHGQVLAAGASAFFMFYNSHLRQNDLLLISRYFDGLHDVFSVEVAFVTAGGAGIRVRNITGTAQGGQPQIKYVIIRGTAS